MGLMNELPGDNSDLAFASLSTPDLFAPSSLSIGLQGETDLAGFRSAARRLLALQARPEQVSWHVEGSASPDLFSVSPEEDDVAETGKPDGAPAIQVPAEFLALCRSVILHSDPNRFGLLYKILWRLTHEPDLRHDPLDADRMKAGHMAQAVRRDMHKMKAFVRFRTVQDEIFRTHPEGGLLHVAWFEPEHHIVEAVAPFFARRFTRMRWAILTPEQSADWDGSQLRLGPGASKQDAPPADAGEQLWLTYYQHIFNPARLKIQMMQKEMPRKYWRNLPEAELISALTTSAHERHAGMVAQAPSRTARRLPHIVQAPPREALPASQRIVSLDALRQATNRCRDCPIGEHATQSVCGDGPHHASLMLVGEQPGDIEDLQGKPFVGPAGQLLDRALAQLGIAREQIFIANAVKHFKYEMRGRRRIHKTPTQAEASACQHWLEDEIALVEPSLLVALGATAARSLLGKAIPVLANRGKLLKRDDGREVLITLHPSALLRTLPEEREAAYAEWLADLAQMVPAVSAAS